jgi:hypothetical protein
MELDSEVAGHGHRVGTRWIDLALALAALLVSVSSIMVALQNHRAMQRLVTANSWPYLELIHGNGDPSDGTPQLHLDVKNVGIGPAMIEKFVVTYAGEPVTGPVDLLDRCCGPRSSWEHANLQINEVTERVLPAREGISFLVVPYRDSNLELFRKLDVERMKIGMAVCYASVFDEHWITTLGLANARSVKSCNELEGPAYQASQIQQK